MTVKELLEKKGYDTERLVDCRIIPPLTFKDEAVVKVILYRVRGEPGQEVRLKLS